MNNIFENKYTFKRILPLNIVWVIVILFTALILILSYFLTQIKIYDYYQTKGYVENGLITTFIPSNIDITEISFNHKKNNYEIEQEIIKVDKENMISYKELTIKCSAKYQDNEIIITKLKEKMF